MASFLPCLCCVIDSWLCALLARDIGTCGCGEGGELWGFIPAAVGGYSSLRSQGKVHSLLLLNALPSPAL